MKVFIVLASVLYVTPLVLVLCAYLFAEDFPAPRRWEIWDLIFWPLLPLYYLGLLFLWLIGVR